MSFIAEFLGSNLLGSQAAGLFCILWIILETNRYLGLLSGVMSEDNRGIYGVDLDYGAYTEWQNSVLD